MPRDYASERRAELHRKKREREEEARLEQEQAARLERERQQKEFTTKMMGTATFSAFLRSWREKSGLTQQEAAEQLQVSRVYVLQLEKGERSPSARFLLQLASLTGPITAIYTPPDKVEYR